MKPLCRTCLKQGKKTKAYKCLSPDLDIQGLCYCKKHLEEGQLEYLYMILHADDALIDFYEEPKPKLGYKSNAKAYQDLIRLIGRRWKR